MDLQVAGFKLRQRQIGTACYLRPGNLVSDGAKLF
jgi:hypothetical protein